jgi:hypothetical protein
VIIENSFTPETPLDLPPDAAGGISGDTRDADRRVAAPAYKLDWESIEIDFGKGRRHTLRRPTAAEVLEREAALAVEIPIGRDGSYQLPDPTANEAADARLYDTICTASEGYLGEVPEQHKSAAVNGLYSRDIYIDEEDDITGGDLRVAEEIGGGITPDVTIVHVLRQPTEGELKMYRRKTSAGELRPGRRGRQVFKSASDLRPAMTFYDQLLVRLEGATLGGTRTEELTAAEVAAAVDPLIKRSVTAAAVNAVTARLLD